GLGPMLTFGAVEDDGDHVQSAIGLRARSSSLAHGGPPVGATSFRRGQLQLSLPSQKKTDRSAGHAPSYFQHAGAELLLERESAVVPGEHIRAHRIFKHVQAWPP